MNGRQLRERPRSISLDCRAIYDDNNVARCQFFQIYPLFHDHLFGIVVNTSDCHPRGPGFDSQLYPRNFPVSIGSGMGSTQPREDNWVATWVRSSEIQLRKLKLRLRDKRFANQKAPCTAIWQQPLQSVLAFQGCSTTDLILILFFKVKNSVQADFFLIWQKCVGFWTNDCLSLFSINWMLSWGFRCFSFLNMATVSYGPSLQEGNRWA